MITILYANSPSVTLDENKVNINDYIDCDTINVIDNSKKDYLNTPCEESINNVKQIN